MITGNWIWISLLEFALLLFHLGDLIRVSEARIRALENPTGVKDVENKNSEEHR